MNYNLIAYKVLDWLKQESPFWWAVVQVLLWASFGIISTNWVNFKGEEVVLVFIGGLISSVGSRTSRKLAESQHKVDPNEFRKGYEDHIQKIEDTKTSLMNKPETKSELMPELILDIKQNILPKGQYVNEVTKKNQIVIHHTSGGSLDSTITWWKQSKERIGTHFIIDRDGTVVQTIPLENWAYHLGVSMSGNKVSQEYKRKDLSLNKSSIGIELCSWGGLTKKGDKFYTYVNREIDSNKVDEISTFRGYSFFEKYSPEQLASLKKLVEQLAKDHEIPINSLTFDININALSGKSGIFTHVEYRTDKSDCYPSKDLIQMFNSFNP